jgi:hypothetical protein
VLYFRLIQILTSEILIIIANHLIKDSI